MPRPPLPIGTWGQISTEGLRADGFHHEGRSAGGVA